MKNSKGYCSLFFIILSIFLFANPQIGEAVKEGEVGFSVSKQPTITQIDDNRSYFYLKTKPNEEQELVVRIFNTTDDDIKLNVYSSDAMTRENGNIGYETSDKKDKTLKAPISEIITPQKKNIELKGNEEKDVSFILKTPKESYDGVKMGALVFERTLNNKGTIKTSGQLRLGVILSETADAFNDGRELELLDVKASLLRGRKVVSANLQNPEAKVSEAINLEGKVIDKKSGKTVKMSKVTNYSMAPNSNFNFNFDWGISNIPAGDYQLKMVGNNEYNKWNFTKDFKVTNEQSKKMAEDSPFRLVTPNWIKYVSLFLIVACLVVSTRLIFRQKNWTKQIKKKRNRRKKGNTDKKKKK